MKELRLWVDEADRFEAVHFLLKCPNRASIDGDDEND